MANANNTAVTSGKTPPPLPDEEKSGTDLVLAGIGGAVGTVEYEGAQVTGFENQTKDDTSTPFLKLLQPTSPQVVDEVPGARQGVYINTVTNECFPSLFFVPAITEHKFIEWVPRKEDGSSGGAENFVGVHEVNSEGVNEAKAKSDKFGEYFTADGNELVETFYVHGTAINPADGNSFPATIAFSSTHIKPYKAWQTKAEYQAFVNSKGQKQRYPLFSHVFVLGSLKKEKGGNKWFLPTIDWAKKTAPDSRLSPDHAFYKDGESIALAFRDGKATTNYAATESKTVQNSGVKDQDIPF